MITQEFILREGKNLLGQNIIGAIDFSDEDILKTLTEKTLPTFSIYVPHFWTEKVFCKYDNIPGKEGLYRIKSDYEIIAINRLLDRDGYFSGFPPLIPVSHGNVVCDKMHADLRSLTSLELTFRFRPPDMIEIFPKGWDKDTLDVELRVVHPNHLRTIPHGSREVFLDLFLADLATDVLGIRQFFSNIQSPFGDIEISLDRLTEAKDKRPDIIEKLTMSQLKNTGRKRIYIA